MEIRRLSLCLAFLLVAFISHSSEAQHSLSRREASQDIFYQDDGASDTEQNDFASDNEQNDAGEGDEDGDMNNVTILTKPEAYKVPAGQGVRLECRFSKPDFNSMVHWKKEDVTVIMLGMSTLDPNKYTVNGTDLIIKNLSTADSGLYKCLVEGQTPPSSVEHHVAVYENPKVIEILATDDKPVQGSDVTLTCSVAGWPAPKIIWSKSVDNNNTRLGEGPNLYLRDVKEKDSGEYLCYAMGPKVADTKSIVITVQKRHHMHPHKTVINSEIGVEALMQCSVHEQEPVTITWYKGDQELDPSQYSTRGSHSNLTVTPRTDEDFGTYTCKAENAFGSHKRSTVLVERPVVEDLEAEGNKLTWTIHSHQPLKSIEIQLMDLTNGTVTVLPVAVPTTRTHEYDVTYEVDAAAVPPGNYEVVVKVENTKGISENNNQIVYEHAPVAEASEDTIQTGQIFHVPGAASSQHPTTVLLSTVLMYLLVRMM